MDAFLSSIMDAFSHPPPAAALSLSSSLAESLPWSVKRDLWRFEDMVAYRGKASRRLIKRTVASHAEILKRRKPAETRHREFPEVSKDKTTKIAFQFPSKKLDGFWNTALSCKWGSPPSDEHYELEQLGTLHGVFQFWFHLIDGLIKQYLKKISVLLSLLWGRTQGIKYKRPKHVICAAMPWTIFPSLVILWGVCWMFYNASQASSPALGFEFEDHPGQFGGSFDLFHDLNFNLLDQDVGFFNNERDHLDPMTSGALVGVFGGSEVQIQAEPGQPIPGLQQQQADMPPSQSDQPLAPNDPPAVQEQAPSSEHTRNPIRCTESGCHSEFGTERELRRHRETVHDRSEFPCAVTGCKRGDQNPFNRLDNLQRHMRKAHGQGEQTPTTALRVTTTRGQKRYCFTA